MLKWRNYLGSFNLVIDIGIYGVYRITNLYTNYYWSEDRGASPSNREIIWAANPTGTNSGKFMAAPISFYEIVKYYDF